MGCLSSVPSQQDAIAKAFASVDSYGNDQIDVDDIGKVLLMLVSDVTDEQVEGCKSQIKRAENLKISYLDFEEWYLSSEVYIVSFIKKKFDEFDKDKDSYVSEQELRPLLKKIVWELLDEQVAKEQLDTVIQVLMNTSSGTSKQEFVEWFTKSLYYEQATRRN